LPANVPVPLVLPEKPILPEPARTDSPVDPDPPKEIHNSDIKSINEHIENLTDNLKESKKADPLPPGPTASPRSGEHRPKNWYRVTGHPGLWAYGYLDESRKIPTIVDIDKWYQDPSYPQW